MGKKASSLNGGKYKMVNINVGEERAEINKNDLFFELSRQNLGDFELDAVDPSACGKSCQGIKDKTTNFA